MSVPFICNPKDETLESLLLEAFAAVEHLYMALDSGRAGIATFTAVTQHLQSRAGSGSTEELARVFEAVDKDRNGTLDFAEYLCLLYLWVANGGSMLAFFRFSSNADVVFNAFRRMEEAWVRYDADLSRKLSYSELTQLMANELPNVWGNSQGRLNQFAREGTEMDFPSYMHFLYVCLNEQPGNRIPGNYTETQEALSSEGGASSSAWRSYVQAFKALEGDFRRFDASGDGFIDFAEITRMLPLRSAQERLSVQSRLQSKFNMVDADRSNSLDVFEFFYLAFLMTHDGSYSDLVEASQDAVCVQRILIKMIDDYKKADASKSKRLNKAEARAFFANTFATIPARVDDVFDKVSYESSTMPGVPVVDMVRLLKMIYCCLIPGGLYSLDFYAARKKVPTDMSKYQIQVVNMKFAKGKQLGAGGQGAVYLGTYDSMPVAGKEMHVMDPQTIQELVNEVNLLNKLDHPHCHFMLGAKTHPDANGNPLLLTEVCEEGSIFDLYSKNRQQWGLPTAWKFAWECASGFECLHSLGYMHRDIKSLNVFLGKGYVCKVADFGMATNERVSNQLMGTPQWMAPEVIACSFPGACGVYDKRCDIFSYAILMWEIYHMKVPYEGLTQQQVMGCVMQGQRPMLQLNPQAVHPGIGPLMQQCWAADPAQRPQSFTQIRQALEQFKPQ